MAWAGAVGGLAIAFNTVYVVAFWPDLAKHLFLLLVVPALLVTAQPIRLARTASIGRGHQRVDRFVTSRPFRSATSPRLTVPLYCVVIVGLSLTGRSFTVETQPEVQFGVALLCVPAGYLLLLPVLGDELVGRHLSYGSRVAALSACLIPNTIVGIAMMTNSRIFGPGCGRPRSACLSDLDQSVAGAVVWIVGNGIVVILILALDRSWIAPSRYDVRILINVCQRSTRGPKASSADANSSAPQPDSEIDRSAERVAGVV